MLSHQFNLILERIDDDRMIKVILKHPSNECCFETSHYSVRDREALLGFPAGYADNLGE